MATIPQLDCLLDLVVAKVTFPLDTESHSIELPAEQLWCSEHGNTYYHGFRFLDFGGDQEQVVRGVPINLHMDRWVLPCDLERDFRTF